MYFMIVDKSFFICIRFFFRNYKFLLCVYLEQLFTLFYPKVYIYKDKLCFHAIFLYLIYLEGLRSITY